MVKQIAPLISALHKLTVEDHNIFINGNDLSLLINNSSTTLQVLVLQLIDEGGFSLQEPLCNLKTLRLEECSEEVIHQVVTNVRNLEEIN